jgi:hypothetical protein
MASRSSQPIIGLAQVVRRDGASVGGRRRGNAEEPFPRPPRHDSGESRSVTMPTNAASGKAVRAT